MLPRRTRARKGKTNCPTGIRRAARQGRSKCASCRQLPQEPGPARPMSRYRARRAVCPAATAVGRLIDPRALSGRTGRVATAEEAALDLVQDSEMDFRAAP